LTEVDDQRRFLEARIRNNGGTVLLALAGLSSLPPSLLDAGDEEGGEKGESGPYQGMVVVAGPTGYRKLKYMWALASGAPLVHKDWLEACLAEQRRLPFFGLEWGKVGGEKARRNYALPVGLSLLEERFLFRPPSPLEDARPNPIFQGKCVLFCCSDASFAGEWKAVFAAAGAVAASVVEVEADWVRGHRVDFLVGDPSWPSHHLQQAARQGEGPGEGGEAVCLVKTLLLRGQARPQSFDWVVQSLVHGRLLPGDAHPRFALGWEVDLRTGALTQEGGNENGKGRAYHIRVASEGGAVKRYEEGDFILLKRLGGGGDGLLSPAEKGVGGGRGKPSPRVSPRKGANNTPQAGREANSFKRDQVFARLRRILSPQWVEVEFFRQPDPERQPAMLVLDTARGPEKVGIGRLAGKFLLLDVEAYFAHDCYTRKSEDIYYTAHLGRG
jgi:hypothetical protein